VFLPRTTEGPTDQTDLTLQAMSERQVFDGRDQVMLFTRPSPHPSSLPDYLLALLDKVSVLIHGKVPRKVAQCLLEQRLARQVILNLYPPGQGISSHIDLPNRYADGIIGVSLLGGCTMAFLRDGERYDVYLPERTVYALTGEARWEWGHEIEGREEDLVRGKGVDEVETRLRSTRVSVTFRWMKDGADVLA
jgi:alkylated DNA repair dioxygenase AlkB